MTARRWRWPALLAGAVAVAVAAVVLVATRGALRYDRLDHPARTVIRAGTGATLAVLTDGARTAVFTGPERTLAEPDTTGATVTTRAAVRLAPRPWHAGAEREDWFTAWFDAARAGGAPDVLGVAAEYVRGAADRRDGTGVRYAGAATYGPLGDDDERQATADFNDYLGVEWTYPDGLRRTPRADFGGSLDCSGFVRMVYGYRAGYPLEFKQPTGRALPRRAVMMAEDGPGVTVVADGRRRPTELGSLQAGDLVFFDANPDDGPHVDHVGIYLGVDSGGHPRFLSSRKTANGPTMGDDGGASILDGGGLYARAFRAAKRL